MMITLPRVIAAFLLGMTGFAVACSSTTTTTTAQDPTDPDGSAPGQTSSSSSSSSSGGKNNNDAGDDNNNNNTNNKTPDELCAQETSRQACGECCAKAHTAGYQVILKTLLDCACRGSGTSADAGASAGACADACKNTACKDTPSQPDSACESCLNGAGSQSCQAALNSACQASSDCMDEQKCVAPCQSKK